MTSHGLLSRVTRWRRCPSGVTSVGLLGGREDAATPSVGVSTQQFLNKEDVSLHRPPARSVLPSILHRYPHELMGIYLTFEF